MQILKTGAGVGASRPHDGTATSPRRAVAMPAVMVGGRRPSQRRRRHRAGFLPAAAVAAAVALAGTVLPGAEANALRGANGKQAASKPSVEVDPHLQRTEGAGDAKEAEEASSLANIVVGQHHDAERTDEAKEAEGTSMMIPADTGLQISEANLPFFSCCKEEAGPR